MDSRFRGNDGGEAGIRRRESDGGGRRNSTKKRRERGNLSAKMDSRFRGNDSGEGGILSAKITAAGEIPIYIGMVKNDGGEGE